MLQFLSKFRKGRKERDSFTFSQPLIALQSDDWGRVGVRDREGMELLRSRGLRLGEHPYDLYSLETADDVTAFADVLVRHRDRTGRSPCVMMNTCMANLDFPRMRADGFRRPMLLPFVNGLPGKWSRPGLMEAYRAGIQKGVFCPAPHALTHFSSAAVDQALSEGGDRAELLKLLWKAETPYIFWRMPWIGYEFWNPERPSAGFIGIEEQKKLVQEVCRLFRSTFGRPPTSACAPGYRSNSDTHQCWAEAGIRVAEHGSGEGLQHPHFDAYGILHVYRAIDFEPSHRELEVEKYLEIADACFSRGVPAIVSVHSINFHSTLKDFRTSTLAALDMLLTALQKRYPDLLYVNDDDLYAIVTKGVLPESNAQITVKAVPGESPPRPAGQAMVCDKQGYEVWQSGVRSRNSRPRILCTQSARY